MKNTKWYLILFAILLGVFWPILLHGHDLKQWESVNNRGIINSTPSRGDIRDEENHPRLCIFNLFRCSRCAGSGYSRNGNRACSRCDAKGLVPTGKVKKVSCPKCAGAGVQSERRNCTRCSGRGHETGWQRCRSCGGTGKRLVFGRYTSCGSCMQRGRIWVNRTCSACGGNRSITTRVTCSKCRGRRTIHSPVNKRCPRCNGNRYVCPKCGGDGKI